MKKWLFNPFIFVAGALALGIGLALMAVTALICIFSQSHFNGLLQQSFAPATAWVYFYEAFIDWGVAVIIFYSAGRIFSRSAIRIIDVAGTFALARWVLIFAALSAFGIHLPAAGASLADVEKAITPTTLLLMGVGLAGMIWMMVLLYNAFITSCNIKQNRGWIFAGCLLITEIISRTILHFSLH